MRALGLTTPTRDTVQAARRMGQEIFNPPNVGGWTSGLGWISPGSILERANYANKLVTARQTNANVSIFDPSLPMAGKALTTPKPWPITLSGCYSMGSPPPTSGRRSPTT